MLRHWIPIENLNLKRLLRENSNPMVILFLENGYHTKEKVESVNKSDGCGGKRKKMTIDSILEGFSIRDWYYLSENSNSISLLEHNLDKIDWLRLSGNPNAIPLLEQNLDKIDWQRLSGNPNAISLLEQNVNKIDWQRLSGNPNAISFHY